MFLLQGASPATAVGRVLPQGGALPPEMWEPGLAGRGGQGETQDDRLRVLDVCRRPCTSTRCLHDKFRGSQELVSDLHCTEQFLRCLDAGHSFQIYEYHVIIGYTPWSSSNSKRNRWGRVIKWSVTNTGNPELYVLHIPDIQPFVNVVITRIHEWLFIIWEIW